MDPLITRRRWDEARDHRVAFALYSHGWAEKMPPGRIEQWQGIDDWLWVCFQERFGVPPAEYHLQRRVEVARYLLAQRGLRVAEAGAAVGCPDPAAFSRLFKRVAGYSPRSARDRGRG